MTFRRQLFVPAKRDYIKGKQRPPVDCILCAILAGDPRVTSLLAWQDDLFAVCANLYPYNAGHLLLFPKRHIVDPRQLNQQEEAAFFPLLRRCLDVLDKLYQPLGFNIGFNIGDASGASIDHLHQHLVPRYHKELGFVDVITGSKIIIEDPQTTMARLKEAFGES
ncbi:MAG: HIT family hydrolase [Candidatus Ozemobacter sibiricus]|jgi:ATP adenylyltransferase|uniref:HIT family hydrolase n=1 Tax=Candidatus Ozemobacter sibiricus TaxID=2268124 RepID=A0A367ZR52_9BACT|nr:MAG: HIT family hydrolase [Candidatus Ozemobacter sibiricus]